MSAATAKQDFDLAAASSALFSTRAAQIGWFLLLALISRVSVYGDPAYFSDESFYFQVGLRMHDGELPYVDMWDRKGPGLFITYWLITFFSSSVLSYQIAATLAAATTAYCVNLIAEPFTTRIGAVLGGSLYLVLIVLFGGGGGQSPVFYNLPMALAALAVVHALPELRRGDAGWSVYAAMAAAGLALTFKQTAICEGLFLGGFVLWTLWRATVRPSRLFLMALGMALSAAAPFILFGLFYVAVGHFAEFWHAMVTANLRKSYNAAQDAGQRIATLTIIMSPALISAVAGLFLHKRETQSLTQFWTGWLTAAIIAVAIIPNFYEHYLLPLCLPISVAAAFAYGFRQIGPIVGISVTLLVLLVGPARDFSRRAESRHTMAEMVSTIRERYPNPRLLVYQGPPDLYRQLGSYPPTPLYYPMHLNFWPEQNVSHLDTMHVMHQLISWQPNVVVTRQEFMTDRENWAAWKVLQRYLVQHCQPWISKTLREVYVDPKIMVWSCRTDQK